MSSPVLGTANHQDSDIDAVSNWAVLNHASPGQLNRKFSETCGLQPSEFQQACDLLEAYHAVYRLNWMRRRAQGYRGKCSPPTTAQLEQISAYLQVKTKCSSSPQQILSELQAIAQKLRFKERVGG